MQLNDAERFFRLAVEAEDNASLQLQETLFAIIAKQKDQGSVEEFSRQMQDVLSQSFSTGEKTERVRLINCFKQQAKMSQSDINNLTGERSIAKNALNPDNMMEIVRDGIYRMSDRVASHLLNLKDRAVIESGLSKASKKSHKLRAMDVSIRAYLDGRDPFDDTRKFMDLTESVMNGMKKTHSNKLRVYKDVADTVFKAVTTANNAEGDPEALARNIAILADPKFGLISTDDLENETPERLKKNITRNVLWMQFEEGVNQKIKNNDPNGMKEYISFHAEYGLPDKVYSSVGALIKAVAVDQNDLNESEKLIDEIFDYVNSAESIDKLVSRCEALEDLGFLKKDYNPEYKAFSENINADNQSLADLKTQFSSAFQRAKFSMTFGKKFSYHLNEIISEKTVSPNEADVSSIVSLLAQLKELPNEKEAFMGLVNASTVCSAKVNDEKNGEEYCLSFSNILLKKIEFDYKENCREGNDITKKLDDVLYAAQVMNLFKIPSICESIGQDPNVNLIITVVEQALKSAIDNHDIDGISRAIQVAQEVGFDQTRIDKTTSGKVEYAFDHQKMRCLIDIGLAHAVESNAPVSIYSSLSQLKSEMNCVQKNKQPTYYEASALSPIGVAAQAGDSAQCSRVLKRMSVREYPDWEIEATFKSMIVIAASNNQVELITDAISKPDAYSSALQQDVIKEAMKGALVALDIQEKRTSTHDAGAVDNGKDKMRDLAISIGFTEKDFSSIRKEADRENRRSRNHSFTELPKMAMKNQSSLTMARRGTMDRGGDLGLEKNSRTSFLRKKRSGSIESHSSPRRRNSSLSLSALRKRTSSLTQSGSGILSRSRSNSKSDTSSSAESGYDSENDESLSFSKK